MLLFATKISNLVSHLECVVDAHSRLAIFIKDWAIQFNCVVDLDGEPASVVSVVFDGTASVDNARCCIADASMVLVFLRALVPGVVQAYRHDTSFELVSGGSSYRTRMADHAERICELSEYAPPPFPDKFTVWDKSSVSTFVNQLKALKSLTSYCVFSEGIMSGSGEGVMQFYFSYGDTEPVTFDIDRLLFYFQSNGANEVHVAIDGVFFSRSGDVMFYLAPVV